MNDAFKLLVMLLGVAAAITVSLLALIVAFCLIFSDWRLLFPMKIKSQIQEDLPVGQEHDFTYRAWGHNIEKCGDRYAAWSTPKLQEGDRILMKSGSFIVYDVEPISSGVDDMVFFRCKSEEGNK